MDGVLVVCRGCRRRRRRSFRRAATGGTVDEMHRRKAEKQEERERKPGEGFATFFTRLNGPPTSVDFCSVGEGRGGTWCGGGLLGDPKALLVVWGRLWCAQKQAWPSGEESGPVWCARWRPRWFRRCAAFQAEVKAPAARWLFGEYVGRNEMKFYWFWRKLEVFEVFELFGAEGVCGGLWGAWMGSG